MLTRAAIAVFVILAAALIAVCWLAGQVVALVWEPREGR